MILAVLGAIVTAVLSLTMVISGDIANEAQSDKGGFCFARDTKVCVKDCNGNIVLKSVQDIQIGDVLGDNCGEITATIIMDGKGIELYDVHGILVSGSHLIFGTDGIWKSVSEDERAYKTHKISNKLYCFNTTTNKLPIYSSKLHQHIMFRDWEEIDDDKSQYLWNYTILNMLNKGLHYDKWKDSLNAYSEIPLVGSKIKIKTSSGFVEIGQVGVNDIIVNSEGKEQSILGVIDARIDGVAIDSDIWTYRII
jgi:hypothetical protein